MQLRSDKRSPRWIACLGQHPPIGFDFLQSKPLIVGYVVIHHLLSEDLSVGLYVVRCGDCPTDSLTHKVLLSGHPVELLPRFATSVYWFGSDIDSFSNTWGLGVDGHPRQLRGGQVALQPDGPNFSMRIRSAVIPEAKTRSAAASAKRSDPQM